MAELFQTFGLLGQFQQDYTHRQLQAAAVGIGTGGTFHRILINDEQHRELGDTHRDGVAFDRERLSALVAKAQQLQSRLQSIYRAMLERTLSANSTDEAMPGQRTDAWDSDAWRIAGADLPLNYSRAAQPRPDGTDRFARSADALGRLHFYRPVADETRYEERAGFFTTASYVHDWDLHQIHTRYATGQDQGDPLSDVSRERQLEVLSVDPNQQPGRHWRAGDLIPLTAADIFTPEYLASGIGQHLAGIRYTNGCGYQFDANVPLYAYVREVDLLPDGVTKPRLIDILAGPNLTDADGDEVPDSVVHLDAYLRGVSTQAEDLTLRDDVGMTATAVNGWLPDSGQVYHFSDAPFGGPNGGNGFDHSVWSGTHWQGSPAYGGTGLGSGQWDDDHAGFTKTIALPDTPLMHPSLTYGLPWTVRIDDYGALTWSNGASWQTLATDSVGGPGIDGGPSLSISSMDLRQGQMQVRIAGYNRKAQFWATVLPPAGGTAIEWSEGRWSSP
jgi:hypothetical protein